MPSNITFVDKVLANRIYFSIIRSNVASVGLLNTAKMALLRLDLLERVELDIAGERFSTSKKEFPELLHNKIWPLQKADRKIKVGKERIAFDYRGRKVVFMVDKTSDAVTNDTVGLIREQFFSDQYNFSRIRGRVVVDIGANVGDSAIYFALNGAEKVFAYEPYPHLYEQAVRNVLANRLAAVIELRNEGVAGKASAVTLSASEHGIGTSRLKSSRGGRRVAVVTLKQIVDGNGLNDALLKSDCEGSEYGIIMNAERETLRAFREMIIEYHEGYLNLVRKLNDAGFEVWHSRPMKMLYADGSESSYAGIIRAKRIDRL